MVQFSEKSVRCLHPGGFHHMAYSEFVGDPKRTIVCVHGLSRNGRDFDWLADTLAQDGYRVICPDLPGRNRSTPFADPRWYHYAQYMADLTTLLAQLDVDTIDWIGTSMGGLLGMMIAAQPQTPIRRLVINDIGPTMPYEALIRIKQYVSINPWYRDWDAYLEAFRKRFVPFGLQTEEETLYLARTSAEQASDGRYRLCYDPGIVAGMQEITPGDAIDLWPLWAMIKTPVLLLRGADSDVLSDETAARMAVIHPDCQRRDFANVGHAPALMNHEQISVIKEWLAAQRA